MFDDPARTGATDSARELREHRVGRGASGAVVDDQESALIRFIFGHRESHFLPVGRSHRETGAGTDHAGEAQLGGDAVTLLDHPLTIRFGSDVRETFDNLQSTARARSVFSTRAGDREADPARSLEERHFLDTNFDRPPRWQKVNLAAHKGRF